MPEIVRMLRDKGLLPKKPDYITSGLCYEVIMGSFAYGASNDLSDCDVYAYCIPERKVLFPQEYGWINGFEATPDNFEQLQKHHIQVEDREYDVVVYNIAKYFRLVAAGNPNMIDSLFVPKRCITFQNEIGELVRENRQLFLSKKCWHTFKGYAYSQMNKLKTKKPEPGSKRDELVRKYGYDVKFAYHLVRLLNEVEQIMTEGDLDLERNREQLKAIRRGEWGTFGEFVHYFTMKEQELEKLYTNSTLRHSVDHDAIRRLLQNCLEIHFGTLSAHVFKVKDSWKESILQIDEIIDKLKSEI
jgi:predicted nucleotidyltransferase